MALFQIKWLRRFFRRHTKPISEIDAVQWKQRFSILYAIIAWNAFGLVCYYGMTGRGDWAYYYGLKSEEEKNEPPSLYFARTLNLHKGKIIRYSNFKKIEEINYNSGEQNDLSSPEILEEDKN